MLATEEVEDEAPLPNLRRYSTWEESGTHRTAAPSSQDGAPCRLVCPSPHRRLRPWSVQQTSPCPQECGGRENRLERASKHAAHSRCLTPHEISKMIGLMPPGCPLGTNARFYH